jgi:2'-5' RNA ligase
MFVAVVPPDDAVEDLDTFLDVRRAAADFRWSRAEQWHLTLAFFAAVPESALDDLIDRLRSAASRRQGFGCRISGGGAFPDAARAKVLWAGLVTEHDEELDRLAAGARAAGATAGIDVGGERFRPHLTLARLGRPAEVTRWVRLLDGYAGPRFHVDRVSLIASLRAGSGHRRRHETVAEIPLG